jgi:hypothetical protein
MTTLQTETLRLMKNGWTLWTARSIGYTYRALQKGGAGAGGESIPVRKTTITSLLKAGLIEVDESKGGSVETVFKIK